MELLRDWFEVSGQFMPHSYCIKWTRWIFWSYFIADLVTFFSYVSDFFALMKLYRGRPDARDGWIFPAFGLFIASCGLVHGLLVVSLFWGIYPAIAVSKVLMAFISFPVAIVVWPLVKKVIKMPSLEMYKVYRDQANRLLKEKLDWQAREKLLRAEIKTLYAKKRGTK